MQCDAIQYIAQTLCKAYAIYWWENKALISIIQIKLQNLIMIMDNVTLKIVMDDSKYMDLWTYQMDTKVLINIFTYVKIKF